MKSRKVTIGSEWDLMDAMVLEKQPQVKTKYRKVEYI